MSSGLLEYAWLIPVVPFIAFLIIVFCGHRLRNASAYVAIGGMAGAFLLAFPCFLVMARGAQPISHNFHWITLGNARIDLGYQVDSLTAVMLMVVTFIGSLIFIYSSGYMEGDPGYHRFFAYLSLFACAMLLLVLANNFVMLYAGWEGVGLCSYLLIGFWFEKPSAMRAAKKAFLVTRTGDCGLALGIFLLYSKTGSVSFEPIFSAAREHPHEIVFTIAALLIFFGAVGKSAQFPLHVWLPDAMEGPTPVSALIHAATMVAAGVYLVARSYALFEAGGEHSIALQVVAWIGVITAFMAATIAVAQNDIKRVLAYSTISQLGFMMLGLGVGGYTAGVFHLMTHAFFKALLFLGSGSVIHGFHHEQDMMKMGGLKKVMPYTFATYFIGYLALAGVPPFAGFWSKDEILHHAMMHNFPIFLLGAAAAFLTAFYMTRQMCLVFAGQQRDTHIHAHESPAVMTVPLMVLALFSALIGLVGATGHSFHHFVHFGEEAPAPFSVPVALVSLFVAGAGIGLGWSLYGKKPLARPEDDPLLRLGKLYTFLENKWYFDEVYDKIVIQPLLWITRTLSRFDQKVIDGAVNLVGILTIIFSRLHQLFDLYIVDGMVNLVGIVTRKIGVTGRYLQTGLVQGYLLVVYLGVVVLVVWQLYAAK
ncbi:MAG: NADH-quinone oxidoreductase subunit L [Armatimonadetes bacterium]|nr:NADH-quinone oxidoreductase subunit L [Armatimonadota bacterium]